MKDKYKHPESITPDNSNPTVLASKIIDVVRDDKYLTLKQIKMAFKIAEKKIKTEALVIFKE